MCGICGKLMFSGAIVPHSDIKRMADTIIYRGPDAEGIYVAPYIGLGQRRLSIIDLSDSANPPLSNEDGSVWIAFNGEIYNFKSLREKLLGLGHRFQTSSDTEVIVHLYEEFGIDCIKQLRGMFSFAIWDANKKRLFAARDRLGKKPFYYSKTSASFLFGSEIKAITSDAGISVSPNFSAIDCYLSWQYVPSPQTAFENIHKLPPGHWLTCDSGGTIQTGCYWEPSAPDLLEQPEGELIDLMMHKLRESVKLRMVADVPIGAFLSGGIDSGMVVALMAMESTRAVKTFSIGFEEASHNELPYAKLVAERYGTEHHELVLKPNISDILPLLVRHYNEPFADSSAIPTYYVSRLARQHVTVALSGDGGDECFAGYGHYHQMLRWEGVDFIPQVLRSAVGGAFESACRLFPYDNRAARIARAAHMFRSQLPERYRLQMSMFKDEEKRAGYSDQFRGKLSTTTRMNLSMPSKVSVRDSLAWMMAHDQMHYLPDCLTVKTDIASMANSLELRSPLLDHEFMELAARIPTRYKSDGRTGKQIFRNAAAKFLPDEILNKKKTGFSIPLAKWFRENEKGLLDRYLLDEVAAKRNLFKRDFVKRMVDQHTSGARDWSNRLWSLVFLEAWFREFID